MIKGSWVESIGSSQFVHDNGARHDQAIEGDDCSKL